MHKEVNKKQLALYLGWLVTMAVMHYMSSPVHGLLGTIVTITVIHIIAIGGVIALEEYGKKNHI